MTSTSPTLPPVTESVSNGSEGDRPRWSARQLWADRRTNPLDLVTGAVYVLFGLQLIGLALVSVRLFDHYHLGRDFSVYYQAWWLIAHGHLNPFSSPSGNTFLKNHFELIMWVLAPLYWVNHSAIDLLWIQDVALVGAEVVIFRWAIDALRRHPGAGLPAVPTAVSVALLLVLNPLLYATAFDDFHSESIAVLFVALAARDLYNGRSCRALLWVAGLLLCGDVAAVYVVAIGLSALVSSRKSRVTGLVVIVIGVAWLQLIAAIGADTGSGLASRYGYLTNGLKPGQHAVHPLGCPGDASPPRTPLECRSPTVAAGSRCRPSWRGRRGGVPVGGVPGGPHLASECPDSPDAVHRDRVSERCGAAVRDRRLRSRPGLACSTTGAGT